MRMKKQFTEPKTRFRRANESAVRRNAGAKRAVNVSIDAEILAAAKAQNINLSTVLETELRRLTEEERIRRFTEENKAFFDSYNAYIERNGVFGEEFQDWDEPV
jgi:antitoxin CcdA